MSGWRVSWLVNIYGDDVENIRIEVRRALLEVLQLPGALRGGDGPKTQQRICASKRIKSPQAACDIGQRKFGGAQGLNEPCVDEGRKRVELQRRDRARKCGWRNREGLRRELLRAFFQCDAVIGREIRESLSKSVWPADRGGNRSLRFPKSEEKLLGVLREKSGTALKVFRLAKCSRLNGDGCTDRVTITLCAAQAEGDRVSNFVHDVVKDAELRSIAIFEDHFKPAILVQVGECERAAVVRKVEAGNAGDVGEGPIIIIAIENVPFVSVPRTVGADEFVDGVPAALVRQGRESIFWGPGNYLAPKKAREILYVRTGNVTIGYVDV